jgi:hypothetical protein
MKDRLLALGVSPLGILITIGIIVLIAVPAVVVGNNIFFTKATETPPAPIVVNPPKKVTPEKTATPEAAPAPESEPKPVPTASLITPAAPPDPLASASGVTRTGWVFSGTSLVDTIPNFSTDRRTLYIDFESNNFSQVASVSFVLNYDTASQTIPRGVIGSFDPAATPVTGKNRGKPFIRRLITLGTCSQNVCTYDTTPHNFNLVVTTELTDATTTYTRTLTLTNLY